MKKGSTLFLKGVLCVLALAVLALCIFAFPSMVRGATEEFPTLESVRYLLLIWLYASAVPFYLALFHSFKLLSYIDKNTAFSNLSVKALRGIKYAGTIMSGILMLGMPFMFMVAEADDAPGLVPISFLFFCAPIVVAVFAALLERLFKSALEIKSENELTV